MIDRHAGALGLSLFAVACGILSACADGTLPARTADDPANPKALETPAPATSGAMSPAPSVTPDPTGDMPGMQGMDHSKMDHSKMDHSKMDHSKMDHSKVNMPMPMPSASSAAPPAVKP